MEDHEEKLYTTEEAAKLLAIRPDTLRRHAQKGHVPIERRVHDRAYLFHLEKVREALLKLPGRGRPRGSRHAKTSP